MHWGSWNASCVDVYIVLLSSFMFGHMLWETTSLQQAAGRIVALQHLHVWVHSFVERIVSEAVSLEFGRHACIWSEPLADTLSLVLIQDIQINLSFFCLSFIKMLLLLMSSSHGCVNLIFDRFLAICVKSPSRQVSLLHMQVSQSSFRVLHVVCSPALKLKVF